MRRARLLAAGAASRALAPAATALLVVAVALAAAGGIPRPGTSEAHAAQSTVAAPAMSSGNAQQVAPRRRYVFPISPARVSRYYRNDHAFPATDLFAPFGTRFVAVTSGVIESVQRDDYWNPAIDDPANRGGRWVSLIGDDGLRYYGSHLARIATHLEPGDRVAAGQVLGYVGVAGNARHTPPHVHFGISCPSAPDDWERRRGEFNPIPFLDDWRGGVMSSPARAYACAASEGARRPAGRGGATGR